MGNSKDESTVPEEPVHRVTVKPPAFMETAVLGWFAVMDAQFKLARISASDTKFYHVLSALPPETIAHIPQSTLESQDFDELKQTVVDMYERTKPELFERLISKTHLTGRPSIFLSELRAVAQKVGVGDDLIRHKFIQSLPAGITPVLASQRDLPLTQLGKLADELMPLVQGSHAAANMAASGGAVPRDMIDTMHQPHYVQPSPVPCHMTQYHSSQRTAGPSLGVRGLLGLKPFHQDQKPKVCRAHIFFGAKARTCKPWCQWPDKAADLRLQPSSRTASPARGPVPSQEN